MFLAQWQRDKDIHVYVLETTWHFSKVDTSEQVCLATLLDWQGRQPLFGDIFPHAGVDEWPGDQFHSAFSSRVSEGVEKGEGSLLRGRRNVCPDLVLIPIDIQADIWLYLILFQL